MRVLGIGKLDNFKKKHANCRGALNAWLEEVENSVWLTTHDIKARYDSADFLADNRVIFNIKGNHYRLVVKVRFENSIVLIEWIGTHAQYSKKKF
jgi:mRNA interferase HigB